MGGRRRGRRNNETRGNDHGYSTYEHVDVEPPHPHLQSQSSGSGRDDVLVDHFGSDAASLQAFLDLQVHDLRACSDACLAHEIAESLLTGGDGLTDEELARKLAEAEDETWAQREHDAEFAKKLMNVSDERWEAEGDWMEDTFNVEAAAKPDLSIYGFSSGECGICMERADFLIVVGDCSHSFCHKCLRQYITLAVKEHKAPLHCCAEACKTILGIDLIQKVAGQDMAATHEQDLAEASMKNKVYCPQHDCGAVYDVDGDATKVMCFKCHQSFCASCRTRWHEGVSCREFLKLPLHLRAPEDVALLQAARRNHWRSCPGCRNFISKQEGDCNWVNCRCGVKFCFKCGEKYLDDRPQAHNIHGRAGCNCPLFDVEEEDEEENHEEEMEGEIERLLPPVLPPPPPQEFEGEVGVVKIGSAKMRRFQQVDLIFFQERVQAGERQCPAWLQAIMKRKQCYYCARVFPSLEGLNNHLRSTRQHAVYACCGRIFADLNGLTNHAEVHCRKK